jgi:ribonuclease M5
MVKIRQAIVVEGRYDKNVLSQIVDAPIFTTDGFGVMNDRELLSLLRTVAEKRGLIILTDPDGAGFVIRNYLKGALPRDRVLHAYVPDVLGKERRKRQPGKEGKLGVEGMDPETILEALRRAGAEMEDGSVPGGGGITKADFFELGLSGRPDSARRREALKQKLGLPAHLSANGLLEAVNVLYTREELETLL